jgi:hypothetical protein
VLFRDSESTYRLYSIIWEMRVIMWDGKDVVTAYFKVLYWHFLGGTEENHETSARKVNLLTKIQTGNVLKIFAWPCDQLFGPRYWRVNLRAQIPMNSNGMYSYTKQYGAAVALTDRYLTLGQVTAILLFLSLYRWMPEQHQEIATTASFLILIYSPFMIFFPSHLMLYNLLSCDSVN